MNTPNLSAGLLGPGPGAPVQPGGGLACAWGEFGHLTLVLFLILWENKVVKEKTLLFFYQRGTHRLHWWDHKQMSHK